MADADLVKLYSGRILELAADIPHLGRLAGAQGTARKRGNGVERQPDSARAADGGAASA